MRPKGLQAIANGGIVVAVEEDHRDVLDAADIGAKADHRCSEIEVPDHREMVWKRRADARRRGARRR